MKKAAILGGNLDQKKLVGEFNSRGYQTILFDYYQDPPAKEIAHKHYQISTYDQEGVLKACRNEQIDVIGTVSTDQPLVTAAYVSEQLGLAHPLGYQQARRLTNKEYMKEILAKNGISTPRYRVVGPGPGSAGLSGLTLPCVIKPVDSSGSRGVSFLNCHDNFDHCCSEALEQSRAKKIIIEEKIEGLLVSVDAIVTNGQTEIILSIDNAMFDDKPGLFRKMTYPTAISAAAQQKIAAYVRQIAAAFQLNNTPLFVHFIVTAASAVYVLELSARVAGGSKPYLIPFLSNVDLVAVYVSQLLGQPFSYEKQARPGSFSCNYIWCDQKAEISAVKGFNLLLEKKIIEHYGLFKRPGDHTAGRENGSDRIGFFYIGADRPDQVEAKTKTADETISVIDRHGRDIMLHAIYH